MTIHSQFQADALYLVTMFKLYQFDLNYYNSLLIYPFDR